MRRHEEQDWDLTISPETVRLFAEKARAVSADIHADYDAGGEHEVEYEGEASDSHHHDGLAEEEEQDLTAEELRELIDDLNADEAAELIALAWIGRGDYDGSQWAEALAEARQRNTRRTAEYLLGMPMLGDWLEDGLEAIGA